jgi:ferritin
MGFTNLRKILALVKTAMALIENMSHPPNWLDAKESQTYLLEIGETLGKLAESTAYEWDDQTVAFVINWIENDALFEHVHGVILALVSELSDTQSGLVVIDQQVSKSVDPIAEAKAVGIDPATIMAIIGLAIELIKWWKERNA